MTTQAVSNADRVAFLANFEARLQACNGVPAGCKALLQDTQQALHDAFVDGVDVGQLVAGRAYLVDVVLQHLWQWQAWSSEQPVCLAAVGGYGRGELHPYSDVDILILLAGKSNKKNSDAVSAWVATLWDCGLEVGHSVRTVKECRDYAKSDITVLTNLLESRPLAGDGALLSRVKDLVGPDKMWSSNAFFLAKWEEQRHRHRRVNDIEYNLEPNIKLSPGGLRDIQTIVWIAKRHFGEGDIRELAKRGFLTDIEADYFIEGMHFLWRARYALHMVAGRHEDRLLFDYQVRIAELFGFVDDNANLAVEKFMQEYYRRVLLLAELNDVLIQHFDHDIVHAGEADEVVGINQRFVLRNDYLDVRDESVYIDDLSTVLETFVLLARHPETQGIHANTRRLLRTHRERIDNGFRNDPKVIDLFNQLLRANSNVPLQLKRMRRTGVLSRYLPVFGDIIGKMQYDLFHIYTVDIHTLEVVQNIFNFAHDCEETDLPLATRLASGQMEIELLYLAALFHDIAKGRGGDHSTLGADDARAFCQLHGISNRDTNLIVWLVENHLIMSTESQKQDLSDPEIIRQFARKVGDRRRLDFLYVLTVADIKGTNPDLWNAWRSSLLRQLYAGASRALRRGLESPVDKDEIVQAKRDAAMQMVTRSGIDALEVLKQWKDRVDEYFLRESVDDIALHTQAICAHGDSEEPLIIIKKATQFSDTSATQITIYCPLVENRVTYVTRALEKLNLSIYDARLMVIGGGLVLDTYYVLDADGEVIDHDSARIADIRRRLHSIMMGGKDDAKARSKRRVSRRMKSFNWPAQTIFSNKYAKGFSVLEVIAPDRPGLLTAIAQVLFKHKIRMHNAKISTLGERVEDIFFVTDRQDRIIQDSALIDSLQHDIREALDSE